MYCYTRVPRESKAQTCRRTPNRRLGGLECGGMTPLWMGAERAGRIMGSLPQPVLDPFASRFTVHGSLFTVHFSLQAPDVRVPRKTKAAPVRCRAGSPVRRFAASPVHVVVKSAQTRVEGGRAVRRATRWKCRP